MWIRISRIIRYKTKLETLLETSAKEKDELRKMVLDLTREVVALRVKVEFFENLQNKK